MTLETSKVFSPNNVGSQAHQGYAAIGLTTAEARRIIQTGHPGSATCVAQAGLDEAAAMLRKARVHRKTNNGLGSGEVVTTKAHSSTLLASLLRRIRH